jgi:hypothetical protein
VCVSSVLIILSRLVGQVKSKHDELSEGQRAWIGELQAPIHEVNKATGKTGITVKYEVFRVLWG